jgi:hypothetical protein
LGKNVDGDLFLDASNSETDSYSSDLDESYTWGDLASYKIIEPTTREQRREAHMAAKEQATPKDNTTPTTPHQDTSCAQETQQLCQTNIVPQELALQTTGPFEITVPNPAPTYPAPLESNVPLTQTPIINPFGEPVNTIAKRLRGRPSKKLTKVQIRNPVGRPRKYTQELNPKKTSTSQTEPQYTNVISSQDTNEKVYASHQYIKETIFYDPPQDPAIQPGEHHNSDASPRL